MIQSNCNFCNRYQIILPYWTCYIRHRTVLVFCSRQCYNFYYATSAKILSPLIKKRYKYINEILNDISRGSLLIKHKIKDYLY